MKKLLLTLAFLLISPAAWAQCTGVFPPNTLCGNLGVTAAPPGAFSSSGTAVAPTGSVSGDIVTFSGPTGTILKDSGTPIATLTTSDQKPLGSLPVWKRFGVAIDANNPHCGVEGRAQERGMLYEANPQILTGYANVFKMWYHVGNGSNQIDYAESPDGINWTCYTSNPVIGVGWTESRSIVKSGSTYLLYPINTASKNIDLFTSPDGVTWTLSHSSVVSVTQAWETGQIFNPFVWQEAPTTWHMLYAGNGGGTCSAFNFALGEAHSTDGINWTKTVSNPVVTDLCPSSGYVYKAVSGLYYLWSQVTQQHSGNFISDITRFVSASLTSGWSRLSNCTFCRGTSDEGFGGYSTSGTPGFSSGQVADPTLIQVGGRTYLYYTATPDQSNFVIKVAIANMTIEQLITTQEGFLSTIPASFGDPFSIGPGTNGEQINLQQTANLTNGNGCIGYNAYYNYTGDLVTNAVSPSVGYIGCFNQSQTNSSAIWNDFFLNVAGNTVGITGADMTPSGALSAYYVMANNFCLGASGNVAQHSCPTQISRWVSGYQFGISGTLPLQYGLTQRPQVNNEGLGNGTTSSDWNDKTLGRPVFQYGTAPVLIEPGVVSQGTTVVPATSVSTGACVTAATSAVGAVGADTVSWAFNAVPGGGWPFITIQPYVVTDNIIFRGCNPSAGSVAISSATLNWSVIR